VRQRRRDNHSPPWSGGKPGHGYAHEQGRSNARNRGDPYPLPPWKQHDPLPLTLAYIAGLTAEKVASIRTASAAWWERFWAKSSIDLPTEPLIQFFWNAAQVLIGPYTREQLPCVISNLT
jgi:hypothetical protein